MSADEGSVEAVFRLHVDQFERVDKLTFYPSLVLLLAWVIAYLPQTGLFEFFWAYAIPVLLVAFMASRRWSALLRIGPAAPLED